MLFEYERRFVTTLLAVILHHVADVPSRQRLRSTSTNQLAVPLFNLSTVDKRAFPVPGVTFWNSLPPHVTSASSIAIFRQRLKTFFLSLNVITGPWSIGHLICYTAMFNCGPCDKFCYLGHMKKNPDDDDDDDAVCESVAIA